MVLFTYHVRGRAGMRAWSRGRIFCSIGGLPDVAVPSDPG
jgi:hypothetical protein